MLQTQWINLDRLYVSHTSTVETYLHISCKCCQRCFLVGRPRLMFSTPSHLSGTTNPDLNEPESDGNKRILCILQSSSITGTSPSDCLVFYQDSRWWQDPPSTEWILHWTIWCWGSSNDRDLGNVEHPFIAIAPRSILARNSSTW